jgi:hypothetical protein|tara:strand:+ start:94 stop:459 length:366 start_codon:yes stop_codon:yes gene_type:complete
MKQKDGGEDYIEIVTKDLKECKNYFERVHLRFAKLVFNEKIFFRQKIWIKFSYLSAVCFIFFVWGFYDYSISEFNNDVLKFVDKWLGMVGAIILSIITIGGVLPAIGLVWAILRSLFPEKK